MGSTDPSTRKNTTTRYTIPRSNIFPRPNCHFCSSNRRPHFPLHWGGNTDLPSNNSTRNTTPRLARLRLQSPPPPAARRRRARLRSRAPRAPAPRTRQPRPRTGSRLPRAPARRRAGQPSLLPSGVLSSCQVLPLACRAPRSQTGIGSRSGPLALKFRQIGAAQDRSGKARTSPTHPSGGISRGARDGRRARHLEHDRHGVA